MAAVKGKNITWYLSNFPAEQFSVSSNSMKFPRKKLGRGMTKPFAFIRTLQVIFSTE